MVRWVVCVCAAGLACTMSNPLFVGTGDGALPGTTGPDVWEWVDSCLGDGPDADCMRRGGSYLSNPDALRCDLLSTRPRSTALDHVGVRCCGT